MNELTDYSGGTVAQGFAAEEATLDQNLATVGPLASGFAAQARTDPETEGKVFGNNMVGNLVQYLALFHPLTTPARRRALLRRAEGNPLRHIRGCILFCKPQYLLNLNIRVFNRSSWT